MMSPCILLCLFGMKVEGQDKKWAPRRKFGILALNQRGFGASASKNLLHSMFQWGGENWRLKATNDIIVAMFFGFNVKNKHNIWCPNTSSATKPNLHSQDLPIPTLPRVLKNVEKFKL